MENLEPKGTKASLCFYPLSDPTSFPFLSQERREPWGDGGKEGFLEEATSEGKSHCMSAFPDSNVFFFCLPSGSSVAQLP